MSNKTINIELTSLEGKTIKVRVNESDKDGNRYHISERQFARCERELNGPSFSKWTHHRDSLGRPVIIPA